MAFYQPTLFYPKLSAYQDVVRDLHQEIQSIAGKNYRVVSAGESICAICFQSDVPRERLQERLADYGSESFSLLLVEVSDIVHGYLTEDVSRWIQAHSPRKS